RDFAVISVDAGGGNGQIVINDISARGHPSANRPNANGNLVQTLSLGANVPRALAHIGSDVSDPLIYVAVSGATPGIRIVRMVDAQLIAGTFLAEVLPGTTAVQGTPTEIAIAGD